MRMVIAVTTGSFDLNGYAGFEQVLVDRPCVVNADSTFIQHSISKDHLKLVTEPFENLPELTDDAFFEAYLATDDKQSMKDRVEEALMVLEGETPKDRKKRLAEEAKAAEAKKAADALASAEATQKAADDAAAGET